MHINNEIATARKLEMYRRRAASLGITFFTSPEVDKWIITFPAGKVRNADTLAEVEAYLYGYETALKVYNKENVND